MKNLVTKILILLFAATSIIAFVPDTYAKNKDPKSTNQLKERKRDRQQKKDGTCSKKFQKKKNQHKKGFKKGNRR
ncbi:MAG: hypothetical protein K8I03_01805 [Ignavibacteria bacterium]|nr:hypothetical protein [Ignavibacteria bacterium]